MDDKKVADGLTDATLVTRREFTANVSHELKTPLTVIAGYAELMQAGLCAPEDVAKFAAIIKSESAHMLQLVDDILSISKLDEDEQDVSTQAYNHQVYPYELAQNVIERLQPFAQSNQVSLSLDCRDEALSIQGSSEVLYKMLYNLCENAIRYNKPGGSVTVSIVRDDAGAARISVADTGIGIDRQYRDKVFERFYCVDKSHSNATGGTGLGLSIVKHGAQRMGATVELESELGEGTEITLIFS